MPMLIAIVLTFLLPVLLLVVMPLGMSIILPSLNQTVHWEVSFILASCVAFHGYFRIQEILALPLPLPANLYLALKILAIISPTCLAVTWLRWKGVKWWPCLLLFPIVPVGVFAILLMDNFPFAS